MHWKALEMLRFPSALWPRFFGDICVTPCTFARSCEAVCWEHGLLDIRGMVREEEGGGLFAWEGSMWEGVCF